MVGELSNRNREVCRLPESEQANNKAEGDIAQRNSEKGIRQNDDDDDDDV